VPQYLTPDIECERVANHMIESSEPFNEQIYWFATQASPTSPTKAFGPYTSVEAHAVRQKWTKTSPPPAKTVPYSEQTREKWRKRTSVLTRPTEQPTTPDEASTTDRESTKND
jgi:hypothetical protein